MTEIRPFVAGAWSESDSRAVTLFNARLHQWNEMREELADNQWENSRPPRETWFTIETKTYRPTGPLRERIVAEQAWLLAERARLEASGSGIR